MATWQLCFSLIPCENCTFSDKNALNIKALSMLGKCLPINKGWCEDMMLFGDLNGTCVEMFFCNGVLDEVSVRLHVGRLSKQQVVGILDFANMNDMQIYYEGKNICPSLQNIRGLISNSPAFKFVSNPQSFFENL
ncbi:MAG: hypothetical protein IKJ35_05790 [Clostridia bacterium]|nr:hypothetical protein [Clostridia bacterium]